MRYAYPCQLTPEKDGTGGFLVTFPDIAEARTCGKDRAEALEMAEDALSVALAFYAKHRRDIPTPSPVMDGQEVVAVQPIVAAKLELYSAMRQHRITRVALAERLGLSHTSASKIVDPYHRSHISQVEKALRAVGRGLVIEGRAIAVRDEERALPRQQRRMA